MSLEMYQNLKQRYTDIKPIRGRAVEVRPWEKRSRDWEQVVQYTRAIDGAVMYAARLHETNVISVAPNGDIHFDSGGWVTPSTAEFMSRVMRDSAGLYGAVCKQANAIWVYTGAQRSATGQQVYRKVPNTGGLTLTYDPATSKYDAPLTTITKKSVNRPVVKEVRQCLNKFKQFYKTFIKMSDGLISADTVAQYSIAEDSGGHMGVRVTAMLVPFKGNDVVFPLKEYWWNGTIAKKEALKVLWIAQSDEDNAYVPLLCYLHRTLNGHRVDGVNASRVVTTLNGMKVRSSDAIITPEEINGLLEKLIKAHLDVWNYKTVTVTQPTKDELPNHEVLT